MKIINTIQQNGMEVVRLFYSVAGTRRKSMRIHYHSMIELSLILRGTGIYHTPKRDYAIASGDIFFFRLNESHCITDIDPPDMLLLNLHIAPYYLYANFMQILTSRWHRSVCGCCPQEVYQSGFRPHSEADCLRFELILA